jgi:hypothetical protein
MFRKLNARADKTIRERLDRSTSDVAQIMTKVRRASRMGGK